MQGNSADAWKVGINKFLFAEGPIMKSQWILQTGFLKMLYLAELQISEKENWWEANKFVQLVVGRDDWWTRRRTQLGGLLVLGAASERQAEVFQLVVLGWSQNDLIQLRFRAQHTHTHAGKPNDHSFCFFFKLYCVSNRQNQSHHQVQCAIWVVSVLCEHWWRQQAAFDNPRHAAAQSASI